jgi:hypothetical protein
MQWFNVKEQLPSIDTDVLVFVEETQKRHIPYDSKMKVAHLYERMISDRETEESKKDKLRWNILDTVLYWMPLPNQPERSKREDSHSCEMRCSEHCGNTMREAQ